MIWMIGVLAMSCDVNPPSSETDGESAQVEAKNVTASSIDDVTFSILLTNVDQLRLRKYGDIKSGMVTTFDENTPLYYLNESTDYEEVIGSYKGNWMRVRTIDGKHEGWVFGASHFVEPWLSSSQIDSMRSAGIGIQIFSNLTKDEMSELTGANFDESVRGTRYSGYYQYDLKDSPDLLNGWIQIRARVFDTDSKEVSFIPCSLKVEAGMPATTLDCQI